MVSLTDIVVNAHYVWRHHEFKVKAFICLFKSWYVFVLAFHLEGAVQVCMHVALNVLIV